jgi:hypothetical protein
MLFGNGDATDEDGRRMAFLASNDIKHPMVAVNKINIPAPSGTEHRKISFGKAAVRMGRFIIEAFIGLGFGDYGGKIASPATAGSQ